MGLFSIFWLAARTAPGLRLSQDGLPSHSSRGEPAFALLCRIQSVFAFASLKLRRTPRFALRPPVACLAIARVPSSPPSPRGFGVAAFTRFASEGWWACLDSNQEPDRYERPALTIELQAPPHAAA